MNSKRARAVIGLGIAGCIAVGTYYYLEYKSGVPQYEDKAESNLRSVEVLGVAVRLADFAPANDPPEAGPEILKLAEDADLALKDYGEKELDNFNNLIKSSTPDERVLLSTAQRLVGRTEPLLARLEKVSRYPVAIVEHDWDRTVEIKFPEYSAFKFLVRVQCIAAQLDAREGRSARAKERLDSCMRLSDHMQKVPLLIPGLVGVSIRVMTVRGARACAQTDLVHADTYRAAIFANPERSLVLGRAVRGELSQFIFLMRNLDFDPLEHDVTKATYKSVVVREGVPGQEYPRAAFAYGLEVALPVLKLIDSDGAVADLPAFKSALTEMDERMSREKLQIGLPAIVVFPEYANLEHGLWISDERA